MSSAALNWLIIRNNNSYLLKKSNIAKPFSTERNNLTNVSSFRYSGLVHKKSLAIVPADKSGFSLLYKKSKYQNRPAKNTVKVTLKHGPRRSLSKLRTILKANKYRTDLHQAALRRASAVLRSQRVPRPLKGKHAASVAAAAAKKAE